MGRDSSAGVGFLIRDYSGKIIHVAATSLLICSVLDQSLYAAWLDICVAVLQSYVVLDGR